MKSCAPCAAAIARARCSADSAPAKSALQRALAIAAVQGAQLFTLRAATDLARLLHAQGRTDAAGALLRPALAAQHEGLEQVDAARARAVLEAIDARARLRAAKAA